MSEAGLTRLEPEVRTLARPVAVNLLAARTEVQRNGDLQVAFVKAKAEGWTPEKLAETVQSVLAEKVEGSSEAIREVALYLADEYLQGEGGILLVSKETGRAIARITEEDIWQPSPVRREDGSLVTPLPRLRPDLEGFLVQWTFDRGREEQRFASLTPWQSQSPAAKQITRGGRQALARQIEGSLDRLLADLTGSARDFLDFVRWTETETPIEGYTQLARRTAFIRTRTPIADLKSFNLRFDVLGTQKAVLGTSLLKEMARTLTLDYPDPQVCRTPSSEGVGFWVTARDTASPLRALVVDSDVTLGLLPEACVLVTHPDSYRLVSREVFDRWEVGVFMDYTLWVDWSRVRGYRVEVEHQARLV